VIGQIADNFPSSSYAAIPKSLFNYGGGGVNAWRNLCGVPNGGAAMLKIVTGNGNVIDEYMAWYERTAFPTNAAYEDWAGGGWTISDASKQPKDSAPQAVAKSLLCHSSHGRWLEAAGGAEGAWVTAEFAGNAGAAGSDRCAKLVYDCVYKLVELVNDFMAGTIPTPVLDPSVDACLTSGCHGGAGGYDQAILDCAPHVAGKMKCDESCHQ
jgi:hypothetical protein